VLTIAGLVERHNGIFGGCWCTYFHADCADREPGCEGSRALKTRLVEAGRAHAALVMVGDEAIAWAQYGTPDELPTSTTASNTSPRPTSLPTIASPASSSTSVRALWTGCAERGVRA
jgi:hypothetical protein